jgi:hypothetical protein
MKHPISLFSSILLSLSLLTLSSCFKENTIAPIDLSTQGKTFTAAMGPDYIPQIYFNLQTAEFVGQHSRFEYDLAFDCENNKFNVWLNGAKLMQTIRTGKTDFDEVIAKDTLVGRKSVEFGYGIPDSSALGIWGNYPSSKKEVFLVQLGVDKFGESLGYRKLQILDYTTGYNIKYSLLDGSGVREAFIPKDDNRQYVFYSLTEHLVKNLEPEKDQWDLVFTMYSTYFYKEKLAYIVNGVLTNTTRSQAYLIDSTSSFESITKQQVNLSELNSSRRDGIGYEWKAYDLSGGTNSYAVNTKYNYIIKSDNRLFKLRMLDFYGTDGSRGYPKFEYEELK